MGSPRRMGPRRRRLPGRALALLSFGADADSIVASSPEHRTGGTVSQIQRGPRSHRFLHSLARCRGGGIQRAPEHFFVLADRRIALGPESQAMGAMDALELGPGRGLASRWGDQVHPVLRTVQ